MKRFLSCLSLLICFVVFDSCRPVVSISRPEDYSFFPLDSNLGVYDFPAIFQSFWLGMNRNYMFWDQDPTDWDAVYDTYKPQFDVLGKFTATTEYPNVWSNPDFQKSMEQATRWFREMTKDMVDGHLQLKLANDESLFLIDQKLTVDKFFISPESIFPLFIRIVDRMTQENNRTLLFRYTQWDDPEPDSTSLNIPGLLRLENTIDTYDFMQGTIVNYLDNPKLDSAHYHHADWYLRDGDKYALSLNGTRIADPNAMMPRIATGKIAVKEGFVLYFYTAGYMLYTLMEQIVALEIQLKQANMTPAEIDVHVNALVDALGPQQFGFIKVIRTFFKDLQDPQLKGVIFDLRGVIGGSTNDFTYVLGRLINSPLTFAYQRSKSGEGRLDYGPWVPLRVMPASDGQMQPDKIGTIPIIALVDELTTSCAEFITMAIQAMPNGYVIGSEHTAGATSMPTPDQKFNSGNFYSSPVFSLVTMSAVQTKHTNGNIYEGKGIPPTANGKGKIVLQDWYRFLHDTQEARRDNVLEAAIRHVDPSYKETEF
jgi:hypothetical protein